MPEDIGTCTVLGTGVLTWNPSERRSDRYGYVWLMTAGGSSLQDVPPAPLTVPDDLRGKRCRLIARVLETRQSTHIGDLFHGVFPRTPQVGEAIVLGTGLLSAVAVEGGDLRVGLLPADHRLTQWLDMRALYDCHEQTVELIAEEVSL